MITVKHLTKCYGDFKAIDDLSFEIDEGRVYGFLGPNGAGKSTTMNIMTGCLSATEGSVAINGYDIFEDADKAKRLIGYLPEFPPLYMNETPVEYLKFVGEAKGLRKQELETQIEEVILQTKISDVRNRLISKLSKGYKQRVGIAQALLGDPKIIILDEPTVGLDPIQIVEIRDLIKELGRSHTVILSSHILSEVQAICEKVLIIANGKLIAFDAPENLEKRLLASNGLSLTVEAEKAEAIEILNEMKRMMQWENEDIDVEDLEKGVSRIRIKMNDSDLRGLCRTFFFAFAQREKAILEMITQKANLEDIFIELTEETMDSLHDSELAQGRPENHGSLSDVFLDGPVPGNENAESEVTEK